MTMLRDNVCILLVSRHLFQLQATDSSADRMKITLVFSLFDRMYALVNRLWICRESIGFKKKNLYSAATPNFLFLLQCCHQNGMYFFLCFLNFSHRDKINSSLYMCANTPFIRMLY